MKKLFTTLFAVLGIFTFAHAQQSKGVEFGIGAGYSGTSVFQTGNQATHSKPAFNVAVSADKYFSDRWSLNVKAIYDQKGWTEELVMMDMNSMVAFLKPINYSLNYITMPVMANWHFGKTRKWYLNFGPYAGVLLSAKESINNSSVKPLFSTVDGGLAYGIGVKLPIAKQAKFYIEYDGQNGLANIFAKNSVIGSNYRNVRGSFNVGLNF